MSQPWQDQLDIWHNWYTDQQSLAAQARSDRRAAIDQMTARWYDAYKKGQSQWAGIEQGIVEQGTANRGQMTAGTVGSGLYNTSVRAVGERAVQAQTAQQLGAMSQARADQEYAQWMDLASIQSQTEWAGTQFAPRPPQSFQGGPQGATAYDWLRFGVSALGYANAGPG